MVFLLVAPLVQFLGHVNSQLVCLVPVKTFNHVMFFDIIILFQCATIGPEQPHSGVVLEPQT